MYTELLNIIFKYAKNFKLPDKDFVNNVIDVIANYDDINDYINNVDISSSYKYAASYTFCSRILKLSICDIITRAETNFNAYCEIYNLKKTEKYIFICYYFVYTIFHELDHTRQNKILNTTKKDNFERILIQNSVDVLVANFEIYEKEHDLFPNERMAIINSCVRINEMLKYDDYASSFIGNIYSQRYKFAITQYYLDKKVPLIEYTNAVGTSIYYDNVFVSNENTNKLLTRVKKDILFENRVLFGLPISNNELNKMISK